MYKFLKRKIKKYIKLYTLYKEFNFLKKQTDNRFLLDWNERYLFLNDATKETSFDKHYLYHTAWAARILAQTKPEKHVDVSSSLYFAFIASAFVPIDFYDYRPPKLILSNLSCGFADLTKLHFKDKSIQSLSCMHVVEHIGLGRFGDPIDPVADITSMRELSRVLKDDGDLLFVVPIGRTPKVIFNAHRIYDKDYVIKTFSEFSLNLVEFTLIQNTTEDTGLIKHPDDDLLKNEEYACGCFWFKK